MADLFYRNTRLTLISVCLILVWGYAAMRTLPRQEDPVLVHRYATILTSFPGASAERVDALVTERIEKHVLQLHEIRRINSLSRSGVSMVNIALKKEYGEEDVDAIWSKVRDRLADAEAELPPGAGRPRFEDRIATAATLVVALAWDQPGEAQLDLMSRLAEELASRLRILPGTREVKVYGEVEEEIRVRIDPIATTAIGLTAGDVSGAIARADVKLPAGQLHHRSGDLLLEVEGELDSTQRIRSIPVRNDADGYLLRIGDIAAVERAVREPPATAAIIDGRPGVAVSATIENRHRVDLWSAQARRTLADLRAIVPQGIDFRVIFDQSRYTEERLDGLVRNLVYGACIIAAVLLLMMGGRAASVVALALPLTVAMVLAEFDLLGQVLHQTSVIGLIIALGLLIDNAIVVVDDLDAKLRAGMPASDAVRRTVRHLAVPLGASTLTTVLAFLPIALMPGTSGEFVGPVAVGVGCAVTSSFALSMTVIPAIAGHLLARRDPARERDAASGGWLRHGITIEALREPYRRALRVAVARPLVGIGFSVLLPILGFAVAGQLTRQFFPDSDRDQFQIQLVLPPHTSLEETRRTVLRVRQVLDTHDEVLESHWFLGESAPRVYYNMYVDDQGVSNYAGGFVVTRSADATERVVPQVQSELIAAFPNARVLALPFAQGPPYEAPIEIRVYGPDPARLRDIGETIRGILARSEGVTFTLAKLAKGRPKVLVAVDEDEARLVGMSLTEIAGQLNASLEGTVGGTVIEGTEELPVRVRLGRAERSELADVVSARIVPALASAESDALPGTSLRTLSRLVLVPDLSGVPRRNGRRVNLIQAFLAPYQLVARSFDDFQRRLGQSGFEMPDGYELEYGGEHKERDEATSQLLVYALPLFVVIAGTIVLSFNSFRLSGIVFTVAVLSVGLALLSLWVFGYPMGFVTIVGTMGLVGLAVNGAIVVLAAIRADPVARGGDLDAEVDVVVAATRHILATTLTTIGGFLPLIIAGGRFWPPMAVAIAGGVAGAAVLALVFAPSAHALLTHGPGRTPLPRSDSFDRSPL